MSITFQLIDVKSFIFWKNVFLFFFTFGNVPHINIVSCLGQVFPQPLGNLEMSVSNDLADWNSILLEVIDSSYQSFLLHIATSLNLITLIKKIQLLEYSKQIF